MTNLPFTKYVKLRFNLLCGQIPTLFYVGLPLTTELQETSAQLLERVSGAKMVEVTRLADGAAFRCSPASSWPLRRAKSASVGLGGSGGFGGFTMV